MTGLAAPSAPDEARQATVERAEEGKRITARVAKEVPARSPPAGPRVDLRKL
jgi:hypothetical protein